jgi:hypothetical protein
MEPRQQAFAMEEVLAVGDSDEVIGVDFVKTD